jgi:hypothetical protein
MDDVGNEPNVSKSASTQEETRIKSSQRKDLQEAIARLLPKDYYDSIIMIGILAGIMYYACTKDTWLLITFIGLLTGGAIEKSRQAPRSHKR